MILAVGALGADGSCALTMIGEPVPPSSSQPPTTTSSGGTCDPSTSASSGGGGSTGAGGSLGACGSLGDLCDAAPCCDPLECWAGACEVSQSPPAPPQPPGPNDGDTLSFCADPCKCPQGGVNGFAAKAFIFETTVPDDGKDAAGGWQVSGASLRFYRWLDSDVLPETWVCPVVVGMPVRTAANGVVPPDQASAMSAGVATAAGHTLMHGPVTLPPGIFCGKLKPEMQGLWNKVFPTIGAKMM